MERIYIFSIELYEDVNGKSEIYEYIQMLNKSNSKENRQKLKKIAMYVDLLSIYGFNLKEPYIKKINHQIWELRPLRDRILFAGLYNNKFVLLNIFMKKTEKTPKHEIEKAERMLKDYIRRNSENE